MSLRVFVIILSLTLLPVVSFFFLNGTNRTRPHHTRLALAVLATCVGLGVLPYNKATDFTLKFFHLDSDTNDLVWLVIGIGLLALGAVLYRTRRTAA